MMREKSKKVFMVATASVLCAAVMLTGTFAWQSISQTALNEIMGEMANPGGRLHDDFNGLTGDKNIYVENFTSQMDGTPIIVRVRLREYMEIGTNAGNENDRTGVTVLKTNPDANPELTNRSTWEIYQYGGNHYGYWTWKEGGMDYYMPTFNMNKDSKASDINGTYAGGTSGTPFGDFYDYAKDEVKSGTEIYDADDNDEEEANPVEGDNITSVPGKTHTAKLTDNAEVMSMAEWKADKNSALGNYWVYDTDGWAYWANPLAPGEATGLLLDQITKGTINGKWYYGIYVESQMVDASGVGSAEAQTGFYSTKADGAPSSDAKGLLDAIVNEINTNGGVAGVSEYDLLLEEQKAQQEEIQAIYEEMLRQEAEEAEKKAQEALEAEKEEQEEQEDQTVTGEENETEGTDDTEIKEQEPVDDESQNVPEDTKKEETVTDPEKEPSESEEENKVSDENEITPEKQLKTGGMAALLGLFRQGVK